MKKARLLADYGKNLGRAGQQSADHRPGRRGTHKRQRSRRGHNKPIRTRRCTRSCRAVNARGISGSDPPVNANANLTTALQLHQAGRFADAARCYHDLLTREPENAEALHLFGVMHHQCGHSRRAVELIGRAAALRPSAAAFHANLAEAYRSLGDHEQAIDCCRTALRLKPRYPEAANNLGLALQAWAAMRRPPTSIVRPSTHDPSSPWPGTTWAPYSVSSAGPRRRSRPFGRPSLIDPALALARANLGQALVESSQAVLSFVGDPLSESGGHWS